MCDNTDLSTAPNERYATCQWLIVLIVHLIFIKNIVISLHLMVIDHHRAGRYPSVLLHGAYSIQTMDQDQTPLHQSLYDHHHHHHSCLQQWNLMKCMIVSVSTTYIFMWWGMHTPVCTLLGCTSPVVCRLYTACCMWQCTALVLYLWLHMTGGLLHT